ncbi:apolipoprotein D-like isoform X3 [Musca autumnalis]|uniref:apolipoprotein D-like isoform X3 n=1 Tax=Musca autumnalis TaxID=221902 RepID=UPI003CE95F63
MKSLKQIIILICLIELGLAQVLNQGMCNRNIPTVQNFDANRYLGRWYEQQKYPFIFELGGKCIYAEYGMQKNGDISVYNYNVNELTGRPNDILGNAKLVGPAKLKVRFNNMPEVVWILTRQRNPSPQYIEKARSVIKQNGLSLKPLQRTNQQGC